MNSESINSTASIASITLLAVIGPSVFLVQPGFVQGLVAYLGFTEQQAGWAASAENAGLALGTILTALCINKIPWHLATKVSLLLAILGNLASLTTTSPTEFSILRCISAIGSGSLIALTFSMMGLTSKHERNFGFIIAGVMFWGGVGLLIMPWAYSAIGFSGVLIFFAIFNALGLLFVQFLPSAASAESVPVGQPMNTLKYVTLAALLLFNIAIGMVWVYLFLVGLESDMSEQSVANALTISQFMGMAGALIAASVQRRFGLSIPLIIGIGGTAVGIFMIVGVIEATTYWLGVCLFNLLWNLTMPYLLTILAKFDTHGEFITKGTAMQFLGYAIGPYIAAMIIDRGMTFDQVNISAIVLLVISLFMLLPATTSASEATN